jgi:sec-independent protein translocase protein TatA
MLLNILLLEFPGAGELILIILVLLLLFGGKKIPEMMRGLGQGLNEFKKASKGGDENAQNNVNSDNKPAN